jgi:folate-binding Fe-S cluster repair protein YgfZ
MVIVTMRHIRKAGLCSRGLRQFATLHGFDWDDFLQNGMPLDQVRLIDDAMVQRVADIAEAEAAEGLQDNG